MANNNDMIFVRLIRGKALAITVFDDRRGASTTVHEEALYLLKFLFGIDYHAYLDQWLLSAAAQVPADGEIVYHLRKNRKTGAPEAAIWEMKKVDNAQA